MDDVVADTPNGGRSWPDDTERPASRHTSHPRPEVGETTAQSSESPLQHGSNHFRERLGTQPVQYICSLDELDGATAQLCGMSAELDPWLLRHGKYNEYGMRRLQRIHVRNVGGVPVQGLVPVHFIVADESLPEVSRERSAAGYPTDQAARRWELEQLIPFAHGTRLISLFLKFVFPMLPILSHFQFNKQMAEQKVPTVLLAAIYASALPYTVHDSVLFDMVSLNNSLSNQLWEIVYRQIHEDLSNPKLAILQASLLYLQRMPSHNQRGQEDTPAQLSFLGSTVALAMSLGLHLNPQPWGIPAWEKRLRKRLWWAVYMQDKWTSLLLGRPPIIRQDEWDVEDLDEADLEIQQDGASDSLISLSWPRRDAIFSHIVRLAQLVEYIHQTFYTLKAAQKLSEDFRASIDSARPIRQALQTWYSGLPEELRLKTQPEGHIAHSRRQGVAALHFCYLTLELFLYRAILRPLARSPPPPPVSHEEPCLNTSAEYLMPGQSTSPWFLDDLTLDNLRFDQLPPLDFAEFGEAAEVTLSAAERCAGIIVNFVGTLRAQDFDVLWYPWIRVCFATVTSFITLLLVQSPTSRHAMRSKELLDKWYSVLRCQHKSHEALMTLGLVRLHSLEAEELDRVFTLSPSAIHMLQGGIGQQEI
ncbi:fungal-specific transcription factor domain-containing protein [Stachybotrys elegans]|uniref:Fungal-specific transcription factor domain-containing protein n=1 Tax=Stachybotrys elegans TaxID=80388 RepID=A0A8K0WJ61_9HYPO|nr:fungal-specific transcription factor domain-containing protein [Stachybotrys elegans]